MQVRWHLMDTYGHWPSTGNAGNTLSATGKQQSQEHATMYPGSHCVTLPLADQIWTSQVCVHAVMQLMVLVQC